MLDYSSAPFVSTIHNSHHIVQTDSVAQSVHAIYLVLPLELLVNVADLDVLHVPILVDHLQVVVMHLENHSHILVIIIANHFIRVVSIRFLLVYESREDVLIQFGFEFQLIGVDLNLSIGLIKYYLSEFSF